MFWKHLVCRLLGLASKYLTRCQLCHWNINLWHNFSLNFHNLGCLILFYYEENNLSSILDFKGIWSCFLCPRVRPYHGCTLCDLLRKNFHNMWTLEIAVTSVFGSLSVLLSFPLTPSPRILSLYVCLFSFLHSFSFILFHFHYIL